MQRVVMSVLLICLSFGQAQRLSSLPSGNNGWLFHQDEYGFYEDANSDSTQKALKHIVTIARLLEAQGTQVVIALTPAKIGLYESNLPDAYPLTPSLQTRYTNAVQYLREQGVITVDIKSAFATSPELNGEYPLFQRLDHHWSSTGALEAAQTVATTINTDLSTLVATIPTVEYALQTAGEATYNDSSLLALADERVQEALVAQGYAPEAYRKFVFERLTPASGGLFGDVVPEIVLVGASFSQGESGSSWPFASALQYALSKEVLNVAQVGKGAWEPMSDYLKDEAFVTSPPKIIIWEIWELFLESFGQANLGPDWLMNTATQIQGHCVTPVAELNRVRSNAFFSAADGFGLLKTEADTYIEFALDDITGIHDYASLNVTFGDAKNSSLRLEVTGDGWTRETTFPIHLNREETLTIPLYAQGDNVAKSVRLYPGASDAFSLDSAHICHLPEFVVESLMTPLDLTETNLSRVEIPASTLLTGLRGVDPTGRWALGPETNISFFLSSNKELELALAFNSPFEGQSVTVRFNGEVLEQFDNLAKDAFMQGTYVLDAKAGFNRLEFRYGDWNGHNQTFSEEASPFAIYVSTLGLFEPGQATFRNDAPLQTVTSPVTTDSLAPVQAEQAVHDLLAGTTLDGVRLQNFSALEEGGIRWALGPASRVTIHTPEAQRLTLDLSFFNPIAGQRVEVQFNGAPLEVLRDLPEGAVLERSFTVDTVAGDNVLNLEFADWNANTRVFAPGDPRPMAVMFSKLQAYPIGMQSVTPTALTPALTSPLIPAPTLPVAVTAPVSSINFAEADLIATSSPQTLILSGLEPVENGSYRWALGPQSSIVFITERAQSVEVDVSFINPIEDQSVTIRFNGSVLQELARIDQGSEISLKFRVNTIPGRNQLSFEFSEWNGGNITFAAGDTRPMAVLFNTLGLHLGM